MESLILQHCKHRLNNHTDENERAGSVRGWASLGFLRLIRLHRGSEILIARDIRSSLEESKAGTRTTAPAGGEQLAFRGEHLMRQAMLVVRHNVDARAGYLVTWSEWPSRHNHVSEQGTLKKFY